METNQKRAVTASLALACVIAVSGCTAGNPLCPTRVTTSNRYHSAGAGR